LIPWSASTRVCFLEIGCEGTANRSKIQILYSHSAKEKLKILLKFTNSNYGKEKTDQEKE